MHALLFLATFLLPALGAHASNEGVRTLNRESPEAEKVYGTIAPKVLIVNLYDQEGESFFNVAGYNLLARNITVPGLSPLFPDVHCTGDGAVCSVIAGEGEINAASSITALTFSSLFDFSKSYVLVAGVAGIDAAVASIGSVTFARFAVQVDLEYEFDYRDLTSNFSTGYIPLGSIAPNQYPSEIYGTEVFELNNDLRHHAMSILQKAKVQLNDTKDAADYRARFANSKEYYKGSQAPSIVACDSITSNVYFEGDLFNDAFRNYTTLITNGTGLYCTAQQEDNAVMEALMRATIAKRADLSRVIIMRTCSDYTPQPPGVTATDNAFYGQPGYEPALANLPIAGGPIVKAIVTEWNKTYAAGIKASNYVGDILGSLGGTPDFGPGSVQEPEVLTPLDRRDAVDYLAMAKKSSPAVKSRHRRRQRLPSMSLR